MIPANLSFSVTGEIPSIIERNYLSIYILYWYIQMRTQSWIQSNIWERTMINFRFASFWNIRTPDWCQFCLAAENKLNICWRNPMTLSLFRNTTIQRGVPAQMFRNHCSLITSRQFILSMYVFQFMFSRFKRNNLVYGYANQQTNKITWNRGQFDG